MSEKTLERKLQIFKIRINSLLEEHADVLAQAQELHEKLQQSEEKIAQLERELKSRDVQEKEPIIINHPVEASRK